MNRSTVDAHKADMYDDPAYDPDFDPTEDDLAYEPHVETLLDPEDTSVQEAPATSTNEMKRVCDFSRTPVSLAKDVPSDNLPALVDEITDGEIIEDDAPLAETDWFTSRGIPVDWAAVEVNARGIGSDPAEWPAGLEYFAETGGGIRFDYTSITGADGWSQVRPDNPPADESGRVRKYVGNSGDLTGERLILTATIAKRYQEGAYKRVLFVEGTGQTLIMSWLYRNDEDSLVVGVPGCYGWSDKGIAAAEVHSAFAKVKGTGTAFVFFDADVTTNPNVWDAGTRISGVIVGATGASPRFAKLPVGANNGVDDWVAATFMTGDGTIDEAEARSSIENLLANKSTCKPLSATRPRAKKTLSARADSDRADLATIVGGTVKKIIKTDEGDEIVVLAEFAPRIACSYYRTSRLDKEAERQVLHDIVINAGFDKDDMPVLYRVTGWPERDLKKVDLWLEQAGFAHAVWVDRNGVAGEIVAAMKRHARDSGVEVEDLHAEPGLATINGSTYYLDGVGAIGADGYTWSAGRADSDDPNIRRMDLSETVALTGEQRTAALRTLVMAPLLFSDPTWAVLSFGNLAWAEMGAVSEGGVYLLGAANIGKTQRQVHLAGMLGPEYGVETIIGANEKVGSDFALGAHNALCVPDDFAGEGDGASKSDGHRQIMVDILEMIARRVGGGEGEANGRRVKKERRGRWTQGEGDRAYVAFSLSGEEFPAELRHSSKQRFLTVEIGPLGWTHTAEDGTVVDKFDEWINLGRTGTLRAGNAKFIEIVTGRIDREGGLGAWQSVLRQRRQNEVDWLKKHNNKVDADKLSRPFIVAAGRLAGWVALVKAARSVGAVDDIERDDLIDMGRRHVLAAMEAHYERFLIGEEGRLTGTHLMSLLSETVAGGRYCYADKREEMGGTLRALGYWHTDEVTDKKYLVLIAKPVSEALGLERRKVLPALRELVGEANENGAFTHQVRLPSGRVDAYFVDEDKT